MLLAVQLSTDKIPLYRISRDNLRKHAGREEYAAHTWNSYPCPRYHPYTWSREFLQRIREVLESATDIAGRVSADLYLGMYSCPVVLIEATDDL